MNEDILIAKYMGAKFVDDAPGDYPNGYYVWDGPMLPEDFDYKTSWDWLMPVCKVIIETYFCNRGKMYSGLNHIDIKKTYEGVVEFIEFYHDSTKRKICWRDMDDEVVIYLMEHEGFREQFLEIKEKYGEYQNIN